MPETAPTLDMLKEEIRELILNDLDIDPTEELEFDTLLFGAESPVGFDSAIFAELLVVIEERYQIVFEDEVVELGQVFESIATLATYTLERMRMAREDGTSHIVLAAPLSAEDMTSPAVDPPPTLQT